MPCDGTIAEDRIEAAIAALKRRLLERQASVVIGANGSFALKGWKERDGVSDVCAYRRLIRSAELRGAIVRAEARTGRSLNPQLMQAGVHSHNGGRTWQRH